MQTTQEQQQMLEAKRDNFDGTEKALLAIAGLYVATPILLGIGMLGFMAWAMNEGFDNVAGNPPIIPDLSGMDDQFVG